MSSRDQGAVTIIGVATIAIRRMFLESKSSLLNRLGLALKAKTSSTTNKNCQITIAPKVNGENAKTIVNKIVNHQTFRQLSDSRISRSRRARTNQGPRTNRTTVASLPALSAVNPNGANE